MRNYLTSIVVLLVLVSITLAEENTKPSQRPFTEAKLPWVTPEATEMVNGPYVLLRVHLEEAVLWAKADHPLSHMIVTDGNVLDNPQGLPHGYRVIGFRGGSETGLRFLVESQGVWKTVENYTPQEPFYLVLWRSDKNRGGN